MTYVYNRYGQVLSETWTKNNVVIDKYRYVYDENGRILRYVDIIHNIEYNYYYNKGGTIAKFIENVVDFSSDGHIVYRKLNRSINFQYDRLFN